LTLFALVISCNKDENPIDDGAKVGGLFELFTGSIIYDVGSMDVEYPLDFKIYNSRDVKISKVEIYHQFFTLNEEDEVISSDVKLFRSLDVSSYSTPKYLSQIITFNDLAKSTTLEGVPIDTIDSNLTDGFKWVLTYVVVMEDGRRLPLESKKTVFENLKLLKDVTIAGTYKVMEKKYFRIGVLRSDLDASWEETVTITALNPKTFVLGPNIGPFPDAGYVVFSFLDNGNVNSYDMKYYKAYSGFSADDLLINGQPASYCPDDYLKLTNVFSCASGSNVLLRQEGSPDELIMSFGYFTEGSGAREFYQKLVKQ